MPSDPDRRSWLPDRRDRRRRAGFGHHNGGGAAPPVTGAAHFVGGQLPLMAPGPVVGGMAPPTTVEMSGNRLVEQLGLHGRDVDDRHRPEWFRDGVLRPGGDRGIEFDRNAALRVVSDCR